ncbi:serine/threonine protein kinase [Streptacidiphilus sp. PB12-B1b]|uniref:protein kinase domain-containing protein n=1 Tax=Streptacidiphilus sp. PB12-B1b TaxID=2705012 RepID=UPI0015F7C081|nr:protein kinase [Streptacidiphilus sp. PB12-B1b]QMU77767.1 serine/threonine protein kinase [Streptacidiphilus sp. PB12-B1b]
MQQDQLLGGRYALSGLLGRGGMADVYLARDLRLERPVAVKVLKPAVAGDPGYLARFRREARSTASLSHPSVVAVFDSGEDLLDGVRLPYLVMEYVHGTTLHDLLRQQQALDVRRALEFTHGVLEGLAYAHAHGIVHRDVKPANVMLTADGAVKVMDFGIARPMAEGGMTLTQADMVIGTAEYLSPEQARGQAVDARSDLYSVGCLLFELLTGRPPFIGDTPVAVVLQHLRSEPQPPSALAPAVGRSCDGLLLRALAKDREQRFADAAQMRDAVSRELQLLSAEAARPTRTQAAVPLPPPAAPARRTRRPRRTAATVAVIGVVGAVAALGVAGAARAVHQHAASGGTTAGATTVATNGSSSAAARTVRTPDLSGRTLAGARLVLWGQGMHVQSVVVGGCPGPEAAAHRVCGQTPAAGSSVAAGTGVTVVLAPGVG